MSGVEEGNKGITAEGSNLINNSFNGVSNSFSFVDNVKNNVNDMVNVITNTSEAPKFELNVNSKWYKGKITIIDLSWYEPYREMGDNVICIFAYLGFLWNMFIRLPDIIRGSGATSRSTYGSLVDIDVYSRYGLKRSSRPRGT